MRAHLHLFLSGFPSLLTAQPFALGTAEVDFYDAARDRTIAAVVHYPSLADGIDAPFAEGTFPVLVHGHGFVMGVDAYTNLRDHFVPLGYVLVLPTTEGSIAPDHGAFGADLAFLAQAMQAAGADPGSPFFEHIVPATALMGHSMGGGASFLGAAGNGGIQALVNFAAAETDPSAIAAAALVDVPTLVFAASEDCVVPAANGPAPMYAALSVPCKAYVNITGGGHCYFAANSLTCSLGELTCGPDLTISRQEQHDVVNDLAGLWLDHFLKDDQAALPAFQDSLLMSTRLTGEATCLPTTIGRNAAPTWALFPVPAVDQLCIEGLSPNDRAEVLDPTGRLLLRVPSPAAFVDIRALPEGTYLLRACSASACRVAPFVVQR